MPGKTRFAQVRSATVRNERRGRAAGRFAKRLTIAAGLVLAAALPIAAQDLSGTWIYQPPEGTVLLELQQAGAQVTGVMRGLDGSENSLEGTFQDGRVIGSVRTRSGTGWFAAIPSDAGLTVVFAALDEATGEPDLDDGWQLEFTRTNATTHASTSSAHARQPSAPASAAPAATPLVQEWTSHLAGRKVSYIDSYGSGGSGYSDRWDAYICTDGTFHFRSSSSMSADVGGVFGNSNSSGSFTGQWRIIEQGGQALLQYQRAEYAGTDQGEWVALGYQNGSTYFDGERVYVTDENDVCR